MRLLACALACLATLPARAVPDHVEAEYRITAAGIPIANVFETYRREGDTYRIDSRTGAEGVLKIFRDDTVVLHSEGRIGPGGLEPLRFEQRRERDPSRDIRARFDWGRSLLLSEYRGESSTHALPAGTQDRLSLMYQFMHAAPRADRVRMHMSNGRKVDRYTYRKVDEPVVETPAGSFATVHYERVTESEDENSAQLWLARDRFNLAVRVVFEDTRGLKLEQTLVKLTTR